jgi:hypothetical protein
MENKYNSLKKDIQEIIDLMAENKDIEANGKLMIAGELLDEILDHSDDDDDLIEISKYQVLLNQLQQKIISRKK